MVINFEYSKWITSLSDVWQSLHITHCVLPEVFPPWRYHDKSTKTCIWNKYCPIPISNLFLNYYYDEGPLCDIPPRFHLSPDSPESEIELIRILLIAGHSLAGDCGRLPVCRVDGVAGKCPCGWQKSTIGRDKKILRLRKRRVLEVCQNEIESIVIIVDLFNIFLRVSPSSYLLLHLFLLSCPPPTPYISFLPFLSLFLFRLTKNPKHNPPPSASAT